MAAAEFTKEIWEALGFYVYRLLDPATGETFYVGKGACNRAFDHARGLLRAIDIDPDATDASAKIARIAKIIASGREVEIVIHRHNVTSAEAFLVEAVLIDAYRGLTNLQGGHGSSAFGAMSADEIFLRYQAPEATIAHDLVIIKIPRTRASGKDVYDAVKGSWVLSTTRANRCDYVLAVDHGFVVGVFAGVWNKNNGRCDFVGEPAPAEIRAIYENHWLPGHFHKRGSANPVRYASAPT